MCADGGGNVRDADRWLPGSCCCECVGESQVRDAQVTRANKRAGSNVKANFYLDKWHRQANKWKRGQVVIEGRVDVLGERIVRLGQPNVHDGPPSNSNRANTQHEIRARNSFQMQRPRQQRAALPVGF